MCCFDEKTSDKKKSSMGEGHMETMWEKMMESCCSDMTDEEKQKWMHHMHECGGTMMGMMGAMMGKVHGKGAKGHSPWDMCRDMVSSIHHTHRIATLATPEVQGLFEDWVDQIENELLEFLKDKKTADVKDIAGHFKISKDSAYYFLTKLAQKGKIKLNIKKENS